MAQATRGLLWLLLGAGLILALAWATLHLVIVPRIGEFRPQLESRASAALGVTVRIGRIAAQPDHLFPALELGDVRLLDQQGRVALQLPRVLATLSPRSLWNLGFEQLAIERPELSVRRAADGRIFVAGLEIPAASEAGGGAADWLFSQTEVLIRGGTVQWHDGLRRAPPLVLQQVDLLLRNGARSHALRLDATPPAELGERISLRGDFRQPLLVTRAGLWQRWEGQLYAVLERVNVDALRRHLTLPLAVAGGSGALRVWLDVDQGRITGGAADMALRQIGVQLGRDLPRLELQTLTGRLSGSQSDTYFELATRGLQFDTVDGLHWPGGDVRVRHARGEAATAGGELEVQGVDLQAVAQLAQRLPLERRLHEALLRHAPRGQVEQLKARWQGPLEAPGRYTASGQLRGLAVAARAPQPAPVPDAAPDAAPERGTPGVDGLSVNFDLTEDGGRASVTVQRGHLALPGIFDEPRIALDQLSADVQWRRQGAQWQLQLANARLANAHAQGEWTLKWQGVPGQGPGTLDLQGSLSRAELAQVHRYLPSAMNAEVRQYVREAVTQGRAAGVRFRVRGDLRDFPFVRPEQGEFRITASVQDVRFAYVPRFLQPQALPWPALSGLQGELVFDHASLQLRNVSSGIEGAPGLRLARSEARIPDLAHPDLRVDLQAQGPLDDFLQGVVRGSPLDAMLGRVLGRATARGAAELQLALQLPLKTLAQSTIRGQVRLAGNELQLAPQLPRLTRARGVVHFSERGFALAGAQARLLGGDVQAEGGTIAVPDAVTGAPGREVQPLRVQGTVTALGLRQATELGAVAQLAQQLSGSTRYTARFGLRAGVPEFELSSSLQGLAMNLPAPLVKTAEATLPLRIRSGLESAAEGAAPLQDQLSFELGQLVALRYVRDRSGDSPRVLRGTAGVGLAPGEAVPMPAEGVVASINFERLDIDAWRALLTRPQPAGTAVAEPAALASPALQDYLPTSLVVRTAELVLGGQQLNQFIAGGTRDGATWRANLDARELSGYLEYRMSSDARAGSLYARLARLVLAPAQAQRVETLLDQQPVSIPALDVVVDNMELGGKKLGRLEVEAVNRGARRDGGAREWRLTKLNLSMPEARFSASGNWAVLRADEVAGLPRANGERRRTVMNFQLDIADAGGLLQRLQMPGLVRRGQGRMAGQVSWLGSPMALDYPSLGGSFNINVERGQFLKAEPGIAKLLGVLSLQALPRRLTLDFRDVFSEGFSFDFVRGDVRIEQGVAMSNNLQMKGVNAAVLMEGHADLARETQELKVVVVPEINAGTASLIATWINPAVGLGSFLAQVLLRRPLIESATQQFRITGTWSDPQMVRAEPAAPEPPKETSP